MMEDRFKFRFFKKPGGFSAGLVDAIDAETGRPFYTDNDGCREFCEDDVFVSQCTGLKDKNGKLIYEGDLVRQDHWPLGIFEVRFGEGHFDMGYYQFQGFFLYERKRARQLESEAMLPGNDGLEIIGNVWEHPHLLENKISTEAK